MRIENEAEEQLSKRRARSRREWVRGLMFLKKTRFIKQKDPIVKKKQRSIKQEESDGED